MQIFSTMTHSFLGRVAKYTDQATSLETEHTVFYMLPEIMSPWL
jgi:hypothetical protein